MAVGFDASSESHTVDTGSASEASFTWNHAGASSGVKGVLVFTFVNANADNATSVTYNGVTVPALTGGRATDTATEAGDCKAWFLGVNVPQGTQAVVVNRTNNANVMYAVAITVTAGTDTEIATAPVLLNDNQALSEQSVTDGSRGASGMRFAGVNSGLATHPPAGGSSTELQFFPASAGSRSISTVRETTAGQGSRSVGFSASTDDVAAVHVAVREVGFAMEPSSVEHLDPVLVRKPLDVRLYDWAPKFLSSVVLGAAPQTDGGSGPSRLPSGRFIRRVIERTTGPQPVFFDVLARSWMPAAAALLACVVPASAAKRDIRYEAVPSTAWITTALAPTVTAAQCADIWDTGGRTADRVKLDVRSFDWAGWGWLNSAASAPPVALTQPPTAELAAYRTADRPRLDVRAYEWAPEPAWMVGPAVGAPQFSDLWDVGGRTLQARALDVRSFDWSPQPAWNISAAVSAPQFSDIWDVGGRTLPRRALDVRAYEWGPSVAWIATLGTSPQTDGGSGPSRVPSGRVIRRPIERTTGPQQAPSFYVVISAAAPTTAQLVPAFVPKSERTRAKTDVLRVTQPNDFGVPDPSNAQIYPALLQPLTATRTAARASVDVRYWEPVLSWITANVPQTATQAQLWPAISQGTGQNYRTLDRRKLDVRAVDDPQDGWQFAATDAIVKTYAPNWSYDGGDRTGDRAKLDVRGHEWAGEPGWQFTNLTPAATVAQTWPAILQGSDPNNRTFERRKLDVRTITDPDDAWQTPAVDRTVATWAPIWLAKGGERTPSRPVLDVTRQTWTTPGNAGVDVTVAITGVSSAGAVGNVGNTGGDSGNVTVAITGVQSAGAVGTVSETHGGTVGLTGNASATAVGTVTVGTTAGLTGTTSAAAVGSVTPAVSVALTSVTGTGAVGTIATTGGISHVVSDAAVTVLSAPSVRLVSQPIQRTLSDQTQREVG